MAAKTPAPKVKAKSPAAAKQSSVKAPAKGLQLTAGQWAAYNKAYSATAASARRSIALAGAARGYRKYRLNAAYATIKRYNAVRASAQAAAVAAYATRQSWRTSHLAHQNAALQSRIELDMYNHANLAGRLQYAQGGERGYMNSAVKRTVDSAQALAYESKVFSQLRKTAKKASRSTLPKTRLTANSAVIKAAAAAAGLAAAESVPGRGPKGTSAASIKARTTASAHARATAAAGAKGRRAKASATAKASTRATLAADAQSRKAPKKQGKSRTAPYWPLAEMYGHPAPPREENGSAWVGDEVTPNCIVTAVVNHLVTTKNFKSTPELVAELTGQCGEDCSIEDVLWRVYQSGWPYGKVRLTDYREVDPQDGEGRGLVIGYEITRADGSTGDHAALSLDKGQVISWGAVTDRECLVEEAWELSWYS